MSDPCEHVSETWGFIKDGEAVKKFFAIFASESAHKGLPLDHVLRQFDPVHISTPHSYKVDFNIVFPAKFVFSRWSAVFRFPDNFLVYISHSLHACYVT